MDIELEKMKERIKNYTKKDRIFWEKMIRIVEYPNGYKE